MSRLNPPTVGAQIPGFYTNSLDKTKLTVYFELSRSVNTQDIQGMSLKMRTIQNEVDVVNNTPIITSDMNLNPSGISTAVFTIPSSATINVGQFYKVQIACVGAGAVIGYYSTVTMTKYTTEPSLTISDISSEDAQVISDGNSHDHTYKYQGDYSQLGGDYTEKVYSYRFILAKDSDGEIVTDTNWQLHNSSNDVVTYESHDKFNCFDWLEDGENYTLTYKVRTTTGIELQQTAKLVQTLTEDSGWGVTPSLDYDNGYIDIYYNAGVYTPEGNSYLVRLTQDDFTLAYKEATRLKLLDVDDYVDGEKIFTDLTIEQGRKYHYCIIDGDVQTPIDEANITSDFEDILLYDGARQLKVRYNGAVNQIHETLQETKVDTLGDKYPYFFRNGEKRYRDFTISGVISFQGDEQNLFSDLYSVPQQPTRERTQTTAAQDPNNQLLNELIEQGYTSSYSDYTLGNYYRERKFREEVYAWLTNGEPKLFRSPSEGNVLVRLLNVNMTPFNGTSRMVYQFSCQAYECDGTDFESLTKNKIIRGV